MYSKSQQTMSCGGFIVATETIGPTKPKICTTGPFQRRSANPSTPSQLHPQHRPPRSSLEFWWSRGPWWEPGLEISSRILPAKNTNLPKWTVGTRVRKVTKKKKWGKQRETPSIRALPPYKMLWLLLLLSSPPLPWTSWATAGSGPRSLCSPITLVVWDQPW